MQVNLHIALKLSFTRLERVLVDLENKNGVTRRWTTSSEEYLLARNAACDRSKKMALIDLHTKVIERWFLLSLKAKYAGKSSSYKIMQL